jgi:hypothetical protein
VGVTDAASGKGIGLSVSGDGVIAGGKAIDAKVGAGCPCLIWISGRQPDRTDKQLSQKSAQIGKKCLFISTYNRLNAGQIIRPIGVSMAGQQNRNGRNPLTVKPIRDITVHNLIG